MSRYALLLRGINLGKNRRVAMADLRALLSGLGHTEVSTLLVSGNVALTAPSTSAAELERQVEQAIEAELRMPVRVLARTAAELHAVIDANPLTSVVDDGSKYLAHFLSGRPTDEQLAAADPVALDPAYIRLGDRVIYQWCPDGLLAAPAPGGLAEKAFGLTVSTRNWNTVTKLGALLEPSEPE